MCIRSNYRDTVYATDVERRKVKKITTVTNQGAMSPPMFIHKTLSFSTVRDCSTRASRQFFENTFQQNVPCIPFCGSKIKQLKRENNVFIIPNCVKTVGDAAFPLQAAVTC